MNIQHKNAADGRWFKFSLIEQMANIGSEIFRAIKWKNKDNEVARANTSASIKNNNCNSMCEHKVRGRSEANKDAKPVVRRADSINKEYSRLAFERALELFDLTIADPKNRLRLREVTRAREVVVDYFFGDNIYNSSDENLEKYFYSFNYAARISK